MEIIMDTRIESVKNTCFYVEDEEDYYFLDQDTEYDNENYYLLNNRKAYFLINAINLMNQLIALPEYKTIDLVSHYYTLYWLRFLKKRGIIQNLKWKRDVDFNIGEVDFDQSLKRNRKAPFLEINFELTGNKIELDMIRSILDTYDLGTEDYKIENGIIMLNDTEMTTQEVSSPQKNLRYCA